MQKVTTLSTAITVPQQVSPLNQGRPSPHLAPSSIRGAEGPTRSMDGGGGPNRSTEIDPEPPAAPWGEAEAVPPGTPRPGNLSSPNPTADLAGVFREELTDL
ncbi:hypothetical protein MANY_30410 [Mycolicibacterium anyangense]|uniref:Uncharacterized protein n=1 Tax=Mycolicibacterium anyangense TaxID=1431246 RepID=A0A6N4WCB3_9MYCO|nr:hypothetical protein MANY_30410 [Mycolicibacterium anyangense]